MTDPHFRCYLIGADTLLQECGEVLLERGHDVLGVVTSEPRVATWAHEHDLPVIDAAGDYAEALRDKPFDYLFAITHLRIIPDHVLELPVRGTVNFHDGPLPRYAGLNAPVWALIDGAEEYGITWHDVTPGVDEGDILLQPRFGIAANETALSLNTKCMATALESFPELVDALARGEETRTPQNLEDRTYFGRADRPGGATGVDWSRPADEVVDFIQALTFGPYENPVGAPKTVAEGGSSPFIVTEVAGVAGEADGVPGEIASVTDDAITVVTGDGLVRMSGGRTLEGDDLTAGELAERYALRAGARLETSSSSRWKACTEVDERLARAESIWARRLRTAVAPAVPQATEPGIDSGGHPGTGDAAGMLEVHVPGSLDELGGGDAEAAVLTAWSVFLARSGRRDRFDLGFSVSAPGTSPDSDSDADVSAWYSSTVPVRIELDATHSFDQARQAVAAELEQSATRGTFLRDLVLRQPGRSDDISPDTRLLPVGFSSEGAAPEGALLWLVLNDEGALHLVWNRSRLTEAQARSIADAVGACLAAAAADPDRPWTELPLLDDAGRERVLGEFNETAASWDRERCVHEQFEARVDATPDADAVRFGSEVLTYRELDERANRLAHRLRAEGVGPGTIVGVHVSRSTELLVSTLGVMKAGAAYLPLDPAFPDDRLAFMIEDAKTPVIITEALHSVAVDGRGARLIRIDADADEIRRQEAERPAAGAGPDDLAYVIYTSGSTGRPKGVLVEHRNVSSFFTGMDDVVPHEEGGVWLAVTSLSFDISVLELFWTLARGLTVVVHAEDREAADDREREVSAEVRAQPMEFGLFMWGNDDGPGPQKYRLMLEGARFFDQNEFDSVWTPERHFHAFGGPFPNPSVTGAALAAVTENVAIRSGSCVSPLHHAIRITEEWAVVDNLSDGRVGLSFAAGWQPNDFILWPDSYGRNKQVMMDQIDLVRRLWRGEAVEFDSPTGKTVPITTLPRPVQSELPFWVTTAGNPETYRAAGEMGANVLTHLLGQDLDEVAEKIAIYRKAREEAGHDPDTGKITLMLHTFVGTDDDEVKEIVRQPMKDYLGASMKLVLGFAWTFPAFKRPGGEDSSPEDIDLESLSEEETETILDFAFERYFETSGLFGTPETCVRMVDACKAAGVDEVACLLDFGVDTEQVLDSLPWLKVVRDASNPGEDAVSGAVEDMSLAAQIRRHGVTHLQCTPSMARLILADPEARAALGSVEHLMVGGEALPPALARELREVSGATLTNMYGPTETTIWSTTHPVQDHSGSIPIGRPIANTRAYVLDRYRQPLPIGVPGDLWIGGPGVTRGYHERPDLTDERFVADPFGPSGARMYRTGDVAAHRDDGVLDFFGRVDHQVKIRGYRIELGEIEAALEEVSAVRSAAVIVREDQPGDQRLVAYVVTDHDGPGGSVLREHLRDRLPEYMVPGTWVSLDRMPLTPNGKIDRRSLPAPREAGPSEAAAYEAPANELEATIAGCWEKTLGVERVGVAENFFDIGGHSLLVVQLHRLLTEALPHELSLVDLYRFPTIRALTDHLGASEGEPREAAAQEGVDRAAQRRQARGRRRRG